MELHNLSPAEGAKQKKQRVGRGTGSGRGFTSGRGDTGQNCRSGTKNHPTFEGGQTPLYRRLPKFGFNSKFKKKYNELNVYKLNRFEDGTIVTPELMREEGFFGSRAPDGIKILGDGELRKSLEIRAHAFTEGARKKIEDADGKVEVI